MPGSPIVHFGAIQVRAVGAGNLRPTFFGFNNIYQQILVPLVMTNTNAKELYRLSNFQSQRAMLKLETTAIDEIMDVNNITIWAKELYTQYPG